MNYLPRNSKSTQGCSQRRGCQRHPTAYRCEDDNAIASTDRNVVQHSGDQSPLDRAPGVADRVASQQVPFYSKNSNHRNSRKTCCAPHCSRRQTNALLCIRTQCARESVTSRHNSQHPNWNIPLITILPLSRKIRVASSDLRA